MSDYKPTGQHLPLSGMSTCKGVQSRIRSGEVGIAIPSVSYCVRVGPDMSNGREMIIMVGDIEKRNFLIIYFFSFFFLILSRRLLFPREVVSRMENDCNIMMGR